MMQRKAFRAVVALVGLLLVSAPSEAQNAADSEHATTKGAAKDLPGVGGADVPAGALPDAPPKTPVAPPPDAEPGAPRPPGAAPPYSPAPYYPQPTPTDTAPAETQGVMYGPGAIPVGKSAPIGGPGAREHDGLFLRLSIGVGAGFTRYREYVDSQTVGTIKTRGVTGHLEVAVGGRIVGNLIIHANLLLSGMDDANRTVSGVRDASNKIGANFAMLGGGATYYFMPINVYVTAALGVAGMSETRDKQQSLETGAGGAGLLTLGKEWWVGRASEWGLGAGLRAMSAWAPVRIAGVESTMFGALVTVAFTATLN